MAATRPNIIWKGTQNYTPGHPTPVVAIINHVTQGSRGSVLTTFQNPDDNQPGGRRSTHFLVCTDGQIWQFVDINNSAWGNGIWQAPDMSVGWIANAFPKGIWPNGCTIQIEHEGTTGTPLTEPQYQSTLALQRWLLDIFKLPADRQHLNGHYQIQSIEKAGCPGPAYPWTRLLGDLQPVTPPPDITDPNSGANVWHCTLPGLDYWVLDDHGFLTYWRLNGRLAQFGYPISGAVADSKGVITQWFERARFEYHPDTHSILLGLVGTELMAKL